MKSFVTHLLAYLAGFTTLLVLMLAFGDYGEEPTEANSAQPVAQAAGPTAAATATAPPADPTQTPIPTQTPTATPMPPSPTPLPTWTPPVSPTPAPPGMHADLLVEDVRWRATGVEELGNALTSDNQFVDDASTAGKFVRVIFEVESRLSEPADYEKPGLMDSQGRRYDVYSESIFYLPEETNCYHKQFNPGITQQCTDIFEVAADAGGYKLIANNFDWLEPVEAVIELR